MPAIKSLVSRESTPHLYPDGGTVGMAEINHSPKQSINYEVDFDGEFQRRPEFDDITVIIKTFERPDSLNKCLLSIRKYCGDIKIYVLDDSETPTINSLADLYIEESYDKGLSAGRNTLLSKVETKYFLLLDDDTIFTEESDITKMLEVLEHNSEIDIVAGHIEGNDFWGELEVKDKKLYRNKGFSREDVGGHEIYDFVINLFLGRTETVSKFKWDDRLKIKEHMEFFWKVKDKLKSTRLGDVKFLNTSERNSRYSKMRDRTLEFGRMQNLIIGVKEIVDRKM